MKRINQILNYRIFRSMLRLWRWVKFALIRIRIAYSISHVCGPRKLKLAEDEVVVLCLVKNGELVIDEFINYYSALGVAHIVFLDNGSEDRTINLASRYPNVTVLSSSFPFRNGGNMRLREYLIDRFGYDRWSLCVDIDEYFDYPHSQSINLKQFIKYLNVCDYSAVVTQMLDMFPEQIKRESSASFKRDSHKYYLIDNLIRGEYKIGERSLSTKSPHSSIIGGVRTALFEASPSLTKHALLRRNSVTKRDRFGHLLDKGLVADVSCVLLHYKFTSDFFQRVEEAVKYKQYYQSSREYQQYHNVIKDKETLDFPISAACTWIGVDKLIEQQILTTSSAFEDWCSACKSSITVLKESANTH